MRKYSISDVDRMDGHEFEYFCAEILKQNGYEKADVTPGSGDQGIDVIAVKDGIKFGVQCKCYSSDIGNKAVQEAYSGKEFYGCHIGAVLSNRHFTASAKELAKKNRILLWDREYLINLMKQADIFTESVDEKCEDPNNEQVQENDWVINFDTSTKQEIKSTEPDKKYNVILQSVDSMVLKNKGRRDYTAQQLSYSVGITKGEALAKMYRCPSELAVNISKEQAEGILRSFHSFGCTAVMEESHKTDDEVRAEQLQKQKNSAKGNAIAIPIMIGLTILFAFLTKLCWDNSMDGDLGILIVVFGLLTVFSAILLFASISGYSKASSSNHYGG